MNLSDTDQAPYSAPVNTGGAAFPFQELSGDGNYYLSHEGMTLRDYVAVKVLAAMITTAAVPCLNGFDGYEDEMAKNALRVADAFIAAREVRS